MLKTKQNQRNIFNFLKLILFVGVLAIVYWQVRNFEPHTWEEFHLVEPFALCVAIALVVLNIWLAFMKWKVTLSVIVPDASRSSRIQSFFAGVVTGMSTPNMVGNFIGRFYYFKREYRVGIILFTLLSNYAQFLASLTFGWVAIVLVGDLYILDSSRQLLIWLGIGVLVAYLIYFFVDNFLYRIRRKGYFKKFREVLRNNRWYRSSVLGLSLARFFVFTLQFMLALMAFGEEFSLTSILAIWQVYLLTMLVPSLFLGKIGVRESIALFVLTGIGMNEFAVLFASLLMWFVNSLLVALVGLIICRKPNINE